MSVMKEATIQQLFDLTGQTALVTGGAGHLGQSLCRGLAEAGAHVLVTSRSIERARTFAKELPTPGNQHHRGVQLDQTAPEQLAEVFADIEAQCPQIDILVNNAQQSTPSDWREITAEEFQSDLQHLTAYFLLSRHFRDHVVRRKAAGAVVMVGSMYGVVGSYPDVYAGVGPVNPAQYQATKGGVIQLTRHLAVCWAKDGVRVNCLSPGPFPGPQAPSDLIPRLQEKSPLARMGQPAELKGPLLLLASAAGSYLTGQNLIVDGGWTAW